MGRIRPKRADFHIAFLIVKFAFKNAMFNLNESNRIVMAQHPADMRMGVNCLSGQVRTDISHQTMYERAKRKKIGDSLNIINLSIF